MALLIDAGTEKVEHGTGLPWSVTCSGFIVINPNTVTAANRICIDQPNAGFGASFLTNAAGVAGGCQIFVDFATTDLNVAAAANTMKASQWQMVGFRVDTGDGSQHGRMYWGDLSTPMAEVSYSGAPADGVGAIIGSQTGFRVGSNNSDNLDIDAVLAVLMFWPNTVLTLADFQAQQFHPHVTAGCELFVHYGYNGTGTQPDLSGAGNNGTVGGSPTVSDHVPLGPAFGVDEIPPKRLGDIAAIGLASEIDNALGVTPNRAHTLGIPVETDTASALTINRGVTIGIPVEVDDALTLSIAKAKAIGLATETDTASNIVAQLVVTIGIATETDIALSIGRNKTVQIGLATESDSALAIVPNRDVSVGQALETDVALTMAHTKTVQIGIAGEIDTALSVTISGGIPPAAGGVYRSVFRQRRR